MVLVPACNRQLGHHPFHIAGKKYVDFVRLAGCLPLVVPNALDGEIDALLDLADGVLLTGSPSNVHPRHFDEGVHDPALPLDPERDQWTLPFIPQGAGARPAAVRHLPRHAGNQRGARRHRCTRRCRRCRAMPTTAPTPTASAEVQYGLAHEVEVVPGGVLPRILDRARFQVNSVHGQGVNRLAQDLHVEARAPDGLIEAFSIPEAAGFNLCVQWHPEWQASSNPVSVQLAQAFGAGLPGLPRAVPRTAALVRARLADDGFVGGAPATAAAQENSLGVPWSKREFHLQRARTVAQHAPRDRDRMPGARPHRRGARQDPAAREVHRRPRHAPARGRGGDGRDRRVPRGRAVLRRHQPDRPRHAPAARPDHGAHRALGHRPDGAGHPRLLRHATASWCPSRRARCCAACATCSTPRAGTRWSRPSSSSTWSRATPTPTCR